MYDRSVNRGQGMRFGEGFSGGQDGFMDRLGRMGGQDSSYADPTRAMRRGNDPYSQGGMDPMMQGRGADTGMLQQLTAQISMQLEDMQALYEKNAACVDEIRNMISIEDNRIGVMLEQTERSLNAMKQAGTGEAGNPQAAVEESVNRIRALMDDRAEKDRKLREEERREREERRAEEDRKLDERTNLENARRESEARRQDELRQMIEDIGNELNGFAGKMDGIRAGVNSLSEQSGMGDAIESVRSDVNAIGERMNVRAAETDKNTHDVGVRIYRNVQASMNDFFAKQTSTIDTAISNLNQRMEGLEDSFLHRKGAATPLTVAALVTGLVNLGVLVVYILSNY
ncbi:MAG: hypothetical protein K6C95_01635 [Lachnospiraceae bacterium]|nr:hypothetical protein [Lachnospiraceae bacterium]